MPHGTPDWGLVGPKSTVYGLDDLGEHAVRLGSPHLWDRRGDVYYETNFSEGLGALMPVWGGVGDAVCLHTQNGRHGAFCVKLTPGSVAFHSAGLIGHFPLPTMTGMGIEYSFSTDDGHDNWVWFLQWWIGVEWYLARIQFDIINSRLQYWDENGVYQPFAENVPWMDYTWITNTGKMVVDSVSWEYNRFLLNGITYPLLGIPVEHTTVIPALAETHFDAGLGVIGLPPENYPGMVDSVIVTQNEPM